MVEKASISAASPKKQELMGKAAPSSEANNAAGMSLENAVAQGSFLSLLTQLLNSTMMPLFEISSNTAESAPKAERAPVKEAPVERQSAAPEKEIAQEKKTKPAEEESVDVERNNSSEKEEVDISDEKVKKASSSTENEIPAAPVQQVSKSVDVVESDVVQVNAKTPALMLTDKELGKQLHGNKSQSAEGAIQINIPSTEEQLTPEQLVNAQTIVSQKIAGKAGVVSQANESVKPEKTMSSPEQVERLQSFLDASAPRVNLVPPVADQAINSASQESRVNRNLNQIGLLAQQLEAVQGRLMSVGGESAARGIVPGNSIGFEVGLKKGVEVRQQAVKEKLPENIQDKVIERIQKMIEAVSQTRYGNSLVVRLDPPELGAVTVKLQQRGDQMYARLVPENSEVEAVLRNRSHEIVQVLQQSGIKSDNIHVSIGHEYGDSGASQFGEFFDRGLNQDSAYQMLGENFNVSDSPSLDNEKWSNNSSMDEAGWVA